MALLLSWLAAACLQDESARVLVERLGSTRIQERDDATLKLKKLGRAAEQELRKAAESGETEVAMRARALLKRLDVADLLSPRLRAALPGLEDRLLGEDDGAWTAALLEAAARDKEGNRTHPDLDAADFEPLIVRAWRGALAGLADKPGQKAWDAMQSVRWIVVGNKIRLAPADLARMILPGANPCGTGDPQDELLEMLAEPGLGVLLSLLEGADTSVHLGALKAALHLLRPISDDHRARLKPVLICELQGFLRREACVAIVELDVREARPALVGTLARGQEYGVDAVVGALMCLWDDALTPDVVKLLEHKDRAVRLNALGVLRGADARAAVPAIVARLNDEDAGVRDDAVDSLASLRAREAIPHLVRRLDDRERRTGAAISLCALGAREGVDALLKAAGREPAPGVVTVSPVWMNGVRDPAAWERLERTKVSKTLRTNEELAGEVKKAVGLRIEVPAGADDETWAFVLRFGGACSWANLLRAVAGDWKCEPVIDGDRIRMLPRAEALEHWKRWWAAERK